MHRLAHRSCMGHRIPQSLPTIARFNSTKAESVPPEAPSSPAAKARIASSWGDLFIPSREEILRKSRPSGQKETNPYTPNLQYLDESSDTSLAGRLAKQWRKQEVPAPTPTSTKPPQAHRLEVYHPDANIAPLVENRPREPRVDHTIAQRRAERLAREAAQQATSNKDTKGPGQYKRQVSAGGRSQSQAQQFEGTGNVVMGSSIHPGRRIYNDNNSSQQRRGGPIARRGGGQMRTGQRDTAGRARGGLITRARKVKEDEGGESKEDISLEMLEEGCDTKVPSALRTPEPPLVDLDAVFAYSPATSLNNITALRGSSPNAQPRDRTQWIRETFGGDYVRFAPQSPDLYLASHHTLGPSKHAELVLSKRRDVVIASRHRAQVIIESAMVRSG